MQANPFNDRIEGGRSQQQQEVGKNTNSNLKTQSRRISTFVHRLVLEMDMFDSEL